MVTRYIDTGISSLSRDAMNDEFHNQRRIPYGDRKMQFVSGTRK